MKRRIFEEKLYLYIKRELPESEMRQMKSEIEKSPENKLLYNKMHTFLEDAKQLIKKVEVKGFDKTLKSTVKNEAIILHKQRAKYFRPLATAASLLLVFGLIYILLEHNGIQLIRQTEQNKRIATADLKNEISTKKTIVNPDRRENTSSQITQRIESLIADVTNIPEQQSLMTEYAPVKKIVYLTDNPKVKIYWMID